MIMMIPMLFHHHGCNAPASTLEILIALMCIFGLIAACVYAAIYFLKQKEYFMGISFIFVSLVELLIGVIIVI